MKNMIIFMALIFLTVGIYAKGNEISYKITKVNDQYSLDINLKNMEFDTIMIFAKVNGKYKIIGQIEKLDGEIPVFCSLPIKDRWENIEIVYVNKSFLYSERIEQRPKSMSFAKENRYKKLIIQPFIK
ncbi:hypothetical protein J7L48_11860 [bacterium]|nr:hypothetical protein [bacterium]